MMALVQIYDLITDARNLPVPNAIVQAIDAETGAVLDIFSDSTGTPYPLNAAPTDSDGMFSLFIEAGAVFKLKVTANGRSGVSKIAINTLDLGAIDANIEALGQDKAEAAALGTTGSATDMGLSPSPIFTAGGTAKDWFGEAGSAIGSLSGPSVGAIHRRKIALQLPLFFPDYASLIAETGAAYIYPTSFAIDTVAGQIFVAYGYDSPTPGHNVVAVYSWPAGNYISCFKVAYDNAGEGLEVVYSGATRYIYTSSGASIARYDITSLPANKASPAATNFAVNLDTQFAHAGGKWYVEQVETGATSTRTIFKVFGSDLATVLETKIFDIADTGFITTGTSAYGSLIPKKQSIAFGQSYILTAHGGYFGNGDAVTGYAFQGIRVYNSKCQAVAESLLDPQAMVTRLAAEGLTVTRIENEGVKITPDGKVYSLFVHRGRLDSPSPTTDGLVIFEEFSAEPDAIDFSADARPCNSVNLPQAIMRLGTGVNGKLINPVTGADFNTIDDVIGWMSEYRVRNLPVSFYTSSITISDYDGALAAGILVRITGTNDLTFFVEYLGENVSRQYRVLTSGGVRSAGSPMAQLLTAVSLRLRQVTTDLTSKLHRILGAHYNNAEEDFLAIDVQSTSTGNNLLLGGGSGAYNAATLIRAICAANNTTLTGTNIWQTNINGFTPGANNTFLNGSSSVAWSEMHTGIAALIDGITAPATVAGRAQIYVDSADGDLKIKFGDGTVKTIVVDT